MVTSAVQGEGKSTTAANLAVAAALAGKRVILVDADLRRASVHRLFGLKNKTGLSSVLTGRTTLSESLHKIPLPGGGRGGAGRHSAAWPCSRRVRCRRTPARSPGRSGCPTSSPR